MPNMATQPQSATLRPKPPQDQSHLTHSYKKYSLLNRHFQKDTKLQLKQYKNTFVFIIMQLSSHDKETVTEWRKYAQNANSTAATETSPHTIAAD